MNRAPVTYEKVSFFVETTDAEWTITAAVRTDGGDTQLETASCSALSMDVDEFCKSYGFRVDDLRDRAWDALTEKHDAEAA